MQRIYQSARQALSKTGIYLGLFSAIVTIVGIIGFERIIVSYVHRSICVIIILAIAYIVALFRCYFCNSVRVQLGNGRIAYIEYDDFFSKQGIIVIPFNRFFDTIVNEKIISARSMVGQFVRNVFPGNLEELDNKISLTTDGILPEDIDVRTKKEGKQSAYPIGTVAKVQKGTNDYYCVALTDVGKDSKSFCDIEMLHKMIIELLKFINREANGQDVYMPLLGSGFARLNKEKQIILEYLISIMKTSNIPIQSKLHIILREVDRESVDLTKYF